MRLRLLDAPEFRVTAAAVEQLRVPALLDDLQRSLFERARRFREDNTHVVDDYKTFVESLEEKGGFYYAHWDGTPETEARIQEETKATIRVIPFEAPVEEGRCISPLRHPS